MGEKLTPRDVLYLRWLSERETPMWGGLYDPDGRSDDPDIARWCLQGLIQPVRHPHGPKTLRFEGGYSITDAGREALASEDGGGRDGTPDA